VSVGNAGIGGSPTAAANPSREDGDEQRDQRRE
jgi:hypothetical protein